MQNPKKTAAGGAPPSKKTELLAKIAEGSESGYDLFVLAKAKQQAQQAVLENPTTQTLATLDRASKALEHAVAMQKVLKGVPEVLAYLEQNGRVAKKTKLYTDIKKGLLKKTGESFAVHDVDLYMMSLPMATTPKEAFDAAGQRRKEEADIRKAEAQAASEEFNLAIKQGEYVPRSEVDVALAARAMTLSSGLRSAFESKALDYIELVHGDPKTAASLIDALAGTLDQALNEFSTGVERSVDFMKGGTSESSGMDA